MSTRSCSVALKTRTLTRISDLLGKTFPNASCRLHFSSPYQLLVAAVLSAQSADDNVNKVTPLLFSAFPDFPSLSLASLADVAQILRPLGLSRTKAKYLVESAKIIVEQFAGHLPNTVEELTLLKGVGRKVANLILVEAFNIKAFPVDRHIIRIFTRLFDLPSPDKIETMVMKEDKVDPRPFHHRLIAFGRSICTASSPDCLHCPLRTDN